MSSKRIASRSLIMLIVLLTLLTLSACGGNQQAIVGKWKVVSGGVGLGGVGATVEFFQDGTVDVAGLGAKYTWPDSTHLTLEAFGLQIVYEAQIAGNELTLKSRVYSDL